MLQCAAQNKDSCYNPECPFHLQLYVPQAAQGLAFKEEDDSVYNPSTSQQQPIGETPEDYYSVQPQYYNVGTQTSPTQSHDVCW